MSELYYLQDSRSYVGNDILFWAINGRGYTTDTRKAHAYTKEEVVARHASRETDIPWPKDYIDNRTRPAVDMQYVTIKEALKGTGIKLSKPRRQRRTTYNCNGCGRFLTEEQIYTENCRNCGADNMP